MSGILHNVITKRNFSFSHESGQTVFVPLVRAIDITDARAIDLVVRVHNLTSSGGITAYVQCESVSLTGEDPAEDFVFGTPGHLADLQVTGSAPLLLQAALSAADGFGHMLRVRLKVVGSNTSSWSADLSIDLVIRDN